MFSVLRQTLPFQCCKHNETLSSSTPCLRPHVTDMSVFYCSPDRNHNLPSPRYVTTTRFTTPSATSARFAYPLAVMPHSRIRFMFQPLNGTVRRRRRRRPFGPALLFCDPVSEAITHLRQRRASAVAPARRQAPFHLIPVALFQQPSSFHSPSGMLPPPSHPPVYPPPHDVLAICLHVSAEQADRVWSARC